MDRLPTFPSSSRRVARISIVFAITLMLFVPRFAASLPLVQADYIGYQGNRDGWGMVAGDFNADGLDDLAVYASQSSPVMDVYLSRSDRLHDGPVSFPAGLYTSFNYYGVAAADLDRDGALDLLVGGLGEVSVLRGNGDGTFDAPIVHTGPNFNGALAVGSLDEDVWSDLICVEVDSSVAVSPGVGGGNFGPPVFLPTARDPRIVMLGDLNHDDLQDLVVAVEIDATSASRGFSVLLNQGGGAFAPHVDYGPTGYYLMLADLDQDGHLDVIASDQAYLGAGDGTFPTQIPLATGQYIPIALADFTDDGIPDLATGGYSGGEISILPGLGGGTYGPGFNVGVPLGCYNYTVGDFDGDDRVDLVANVYIQGMAVVIGHDPDGGLMAGRRIATSIVPDRVALADFDLDTKLDAVVADRAAGALWFFHGEGNGDLTQQTSYPTTQIQELAVADLNRDGKPDVVAKNSSNTAILLGNGDGTWTAKPPVTASKIQIGDLDGDANPDLLSGGTWAWLRGNGDGTFQAPQSIGTGGGGDVTLGDMNNDGALDIVATRGSNTLTVFLNNGVGAFTASGSIAFSALSHSLTALSTNDMNGDGNLDVIGRDDMTGFADGRHIYVLLGNGSGGLGTRTDYWGPGNAFFFSDLDHDGHDDVIVGGGVNRQVGVYRGSGDGTLDPLRTFGDGGERAGSSSSSGVAVGDLDGDGGLDFVLAEAFTPALSVFRNLHPPGVLDVTPPAISPMALPRLALRPNPARSLMRAEALLHDDSPARITVLDVSGRTVFEQRLAKGSGTKSVEFGRGLPPGLYFVRLTQRDRSVTARAAILD